MLSAPQLAESSLCLWLITLWRAACLAQSPETQNIINTRVPFGKWSSWPTIAVKVSTRAGGQGLLCVQNRENVGMRYINTRHTEYLVFIHQIRKVLFLLTCYGHLSVADRYGKKISKERPERSFIKCEWWLCEWKIRFKILKKKTDVTKQT